MVARYVIPRPGRSQGERLVHFRWRGAARIGCVQRIAAHRLVPEAPPGLDALVVRERCADGPVRRLCAAGDVGFSGRLAALPANGHDPFREVAPVLRSADLAFANLETPLVDEARGRLFAAPSAAAPLLAGAGFGLLNLANNHILDHGPETLAATRRALAAAGIRTLGAGAGTKRARRPVVVDLEGLRVGWLGCARTLQRQDGAAEGFWEYDPQELATAVAAARAAADVLVVSIHMGYMYVDYPHPRQRRKVLELLDRGADLVLLHHAHVVQGVESGAGGGLACYNLGNLLLDWEEGEVAVDQMPEEQRSGGIFLFDLDRRGVCRALVLPVRVDDGWTVRWAMAEAGRKILDRVERASDWSRDAGALFHRQLAERATGLAFRTVARELARGRLRALLALLPRLRPHHLRMVAGWLRARLRRGSGWTSAAD